MATVALSAAPASAAIAGTTSVGTGVRTAVRAEAGFVTVDPVRFALVGEPGRLELTSHRARLWYSFQPADERAADRPLFVFVNGGPGAATSTGLFALNTARRTLDPRVTGGADTAPNPWSWTTLGNLLYVDARDTGFSYLMTPQAASGAARTTLFGAADFNPFLDAADLVRVLLGFLEGHPALRDNPIVLVGESYGGERVTNALHELLAYRTYGNGTAPYQDPALVLTIQRHYDAVFPAYRGRTVPASVAARQFGHQILIQPQLSDGYYDVAAGKLLDRPAPVLQRISAQTGYPYLTCDQREQLLGQQECDPYDNATSWVDGIAHRDLYSYPHPRDWSDDLSARAGERLVSSPGVLSEATGTDVTRVSELYASTRRDVAVRVPDPRFTGDQAPGADWVATFGALRPWDRAMVSWNPPVYVAFVANQAVEQGHPVDIASNDVGHRFLRNVRHVRTFLTDAALDLVVYSPGLRAAIAMHRELLSGLRLDRHSPSTARRPGRLVLTYRDGSTRTVRYPRYASSGHAVALGQPGALMRDVAGWLGPLAR